MGKYGAHELNYSSDIDLIIFFDRDDPGSLLSITQDMRAAMTGTGTGKSLLVHVAGTRSLACRQPITKMSSVFIDLALAAGVPIIPVRFMGGLPVLPLEERIEFPFQFGRQDYWLGRPLMPEALAELSLKEKLETVLNALNGLGPDLSLETPAPGEAAFAASVAAWRARSGASLNDAVLYSALCKLAHPSPETRSLLAGARSGRLLLQPDPRSQWLGCLARRVYGPHGPILEGLR